LERRKEAATGKSEAHIVYAQSLACKNEVHHQIMKRINPAILALSEIKSTFDIKDYEINVPDYRKM